MTRLSYDRRAGARATLTTLLTLLLAACATNPASRRAALIADADRDAKLAVANEARLNAETIPPRTLAVVPFTVATRDTLLTPLGFGLADLLTTDLSQSSQLQMVERLRIDAILRELRLVDAGVTDPRTAPRAGRLMGARRLLTGSIVPGARGAGTIRLQARVIDVVNGTAQNLVSADAPLDRIFDAEKSLALLLLERLGVSITPAQRVAIEQRQTTQLATLVAFGRGAEAEARGDATAAVKAYEEAARLDAAFVASQPRFAPSASSASTSRASSVQRVLSLSTQALNQPAAAQVSEVAGVALPASLTIPLVITIRVLP
jgi:TolB-like protein